jgi:uncharacterized membrane protein YgdD (TMEM256/DUF423 family)
LSAVVGFLGVALGAFGAHGLKDILTRQESMATWQTAVLYHLIHAVVLTFLSMGTPFRRGPWLCFLAGVVLFSGSLYGLALTGLRWLGPITPLGGVFFLVGWAWLAVQGAQPRSEADSWPKR